MAKEWISGNEEENLKFKREALLNYGVGRWNLNQAYSVGPTSELVRECSPKTFDEWESYYFDNAKQKKRDGIRVTKDYIRDLGLKLHTKLSEVIRCELDSIQEDECIDYVYNLVLNRTYVGYRTEVETIYGQLQDILQTDIHPAPDKWDRSYCVDFYIQVKDKYIGLQVKPIASGLALDHYQWENMHQVNHERFCKDHGGHVFFVYSTESTEKKKMIHNIEVLKELQDEIKRLQSL